MNQRGTEQTDNGCRNLGISLMKALVLTAIVSNAGCNRGSESKHAAILDYPGGKQGGPEYKPTVVQTNIKKPVSDCKLNSQLPIECEIEMHLGNDNKLPSLCVVELYRFERGGISLCGNQIGRLERIGEAEIICRVKLTRHIPWDKGKYRIVVKCTDEVFDAKTISSKSIELAKSIVDFQVN